MMQMKRIAPVIMASGDSLIGYLASGASNQSVESDERKAENRKWKALKHFLLSTLGFRLTTHHSSLLNNNGQAKHLAQDVHARRSRERDHCCGGAA
jgi:hypothetical protein